MSTKPDTIVKNYIAQVKKKLPEWFRDNKAELQDTLDEIENHVWDKACEIAGSDNPSVRNVELAIESIGNPSEIAKDYKKRGTPAIFITKELLPLYYKSSLLIFGVLLALEMVGLLFQIGIIAAWDFVTQFFGGMFITAISVLFFTSLIFVILSREGYLPENLGVKPKIDKSKSQTQTSVEYNEIESGTATALKKPFEVKKGSKLFEGLFLLFFGFFFLFQPLLPQFDYIIFNQLFNSEISLWFRLIGVLSIYEGVLNLNRATLAKNNLNGHLIIMILIVIDIIPSLWLLIWLDGNTALIPTLAEIFTEVPELIALENLNIFNLEINIQFFIRFVIFFVVWDFCERIFKIYKLFHYKQTLGNL